jgi:acetyl-CoA synthetase
MSINTSDHHLYPVPASLATSAHINRERYETLYRQSVEQPDAFWAAQASQFLTFERLWDTVVDYDMKRGYAQWFAGSLLNVSVNCIDRHLATRGEQTAIIWEGDDPSQDKRITYRELHKHVCQLANALKVRGVKRGDRVCIYMPMIPEAAYAMLACTRIGAVHSIVFGGFSPEALKDRILDSDCRVVITADEGMRGGKSVPLKANVDTALQHCVNVHTVFTVKRTGGNIAWQASRDVWYHEFVDDQDEQCDPEWMGAEDPLIYFVHLRLYRKTKRCFAHDCRLFIDGGNDAQIYI